MARLVAGIDSSTQSTKALVVDADTGEVVATGRASHEVTGTDGARETHPDVWWQALVDSLGATGLADRVAAVSIGGQQHGMVVCGGDGEPLRPAVLWNDTRSADAADALVDDLGGPAAWAEEVGSVPLASFTVTSWAWLRANEPDVADAARAVRLPHDHLTTRLTGEATTDRGDASGTGWWSPTTGRYSQRVLGLERVGLDEGLLPRVLGPGEAAGRLTGAAADATGLGPGTLVGPGTGDNMAAALGLGLVPGVPLISLGTSGVADVVSETPTSDPSGVVAGFADATGRYLPLACTLNCTLAVDRVAEWLGLDRDDVADATDAVVLPYLDGERTPNLPNAAGTITGLRHATTPQQVLLAAYEGAVEALLSAFDTMTQLGATVDPDAPVVLVGGGARGAAWRRVVAELGGRPVLVPGTGELVAYGAAAQAAAVLDDADPLEVASSWPGGEGELVEPGRDRSGRREAIARTRELLRELNEA